MPKLNKLMSEAKKKALKEEAEKNTVVSMKRGRDLPVTTKSGAPLDHASKHAPKPSELLPTSQRIGISKGITKNMDNYESLRIDVWLSDSVLPNESVEEAYDRLNHIVDEVLMNTFNESVEAYSS